MVETLRLPVALGIAAAVSSKIAVEARVRLNWTRHSKHRSSLRAERKTSSPQLTQVALAKSLDATCAVGTEDSFRSTPPAPGVAHDGLTQAAETADRGLKQVGPLLKEPLGLTKGESPATWAIPNDIGDR